jgi:UDP-N-acetylmuramoyl-tripeptide--D-alanyl-D-alanine ligase
MSFNFNCLDEEFFESSSQAFKCQFDSRKIEAGDVFFALKGEKADGHDYLDKASSNGAKIAVVDKKYEGSSYGMKLYKVDDVLETMQVLAEKMLRKKTIKVIGITGSVGKTTTKEFAYTLLSENFSICKSPKNFNSQIGLPLSILNFQYKDSNEDIALLEMGMSEKGEMKKLSNIVKADIVLITKVGLVHAGNFDSLEDIMYEKSQIFNEKTKVKIVNYELVEFKQFFQKDDCITYSIKDKAADYFLCVNTNRVLIRNKNGLEIRPFKTCITETHLLENLLASYVLARELKMTHSDIEKRFSFLKTEPMRFEKIKANGILFIKDCYNANSISMKAALENLPDVTGKKIAVLGEMKELGKFSKQEHEMIGEIASEKIEVLLCYGKECKYMIEKFNLKDNAFLFENLNDLIDKLKRIMKKGDLVLVKGSRSLELERIFNFCL